MSILHDEIHEQPHALGLTLALNRGAVAELARAIRKRDIRFICIAARGTSDNAATYAQYLFQILVGVPVGLATPSVQTLYDASVRYAGDTLVIGISQSGQGDDINEVVRQARSTGALTTAITNTESAPLARIAEHVLLCGVGREHAVAATKTYTSTLAILAALAAEWSGSVPLRDGLDRVGDSATASLSVEDGVRALAQTLIHAERFLTVARGPHLSTALEAALKIAETTGSPTQSFSSADLQHGPIASVAVRTPCLLFQPAGRTQAGMTEIADLLRTRGARVIRFLPTTETADDITLHDTGTELLAPLVDILPAQLLAYHLTVARGLDPDNPVGLSKVTITR